MPEIAHSVVEKLWQNYIRKVSDAQSIAEALNSRQETWLEDHIAFRTLPGEKTGAHVLQEIFEFLGYERRDDYSFTEKKLSAFWLAPSQELIASGHIPPKVFISELEAHKFSPEVQDIIQRIAQSASTPLDLKKVQGMDPDAAAEAIASFLSDGATWPAITKKEYEVLSECSEYAAWTAVYGNCPNHFTVSVHLMEGFQSIQQLASFIESDLGIELNTSGGVIKGTPDVLLEQFSTLAKPCTVKLADDTLDIPYAFIEFAYRWPLPNQSHDKQWHSYYQGFVANNADKIFESTNVKK